MLEEELETLKNEAGKFNHLLTDFYLVMNGAQSVLSKEKDEDKCAKLADEFLSTTEKAYLRDKNMLNLILEDYVPFCKTMVKKLSALEISCVEKARNSDDPLILEFRTAREAYRGIHMPISRRMSEISSIFRYIGECYSGKFEPWFLQEPVWEEGIVAYSAFLECVKELNECVFDYRASNIRVREAVDKKKFKPLGPGSIDKRWGRNLRIEPPEEP